MKLSSYPIPRLLLQAENRRRTAAGLFGRAHRLQRLPGRGDSLPYPGRKTKGRRSQGPGVPGTLRSRTLLSRTPGPRSGGATAGEPGAGGSFPSPWHTPGGHQRSSLYQQGRRGRPGYPALRRHQPQTQRPGTDALPQRSLLSENRRRNDGAFRRSARSPDQHPQDRRNGEPEHRVSGPMLPDYENSLGVRSPETISAI